MRTAEKDLKNIRKVLNYSIEDFSESIGIEEEQLRLIESDERKLTNSELYRICSILLNTVDSLLSSENDIEIEDVSIRKRVNDRKQFVFKMMTEYISIYHPMNKDYKQNIGTISVINENELINPKDTRRKMKKVLKKLNK